MDFVYVAPEPPPLVGEALPRSTPGSEAIASLDDAIAGFVDLDVKGLCLQWRNHLGEQSAPVRHPIFRRACAPSTTTPTCEPPLSAS